MKELLARLTRAAVLDAADRLAEARTTGSSEGSRGFKVGSFQDPSACTRYFTAA
jgi:hypothetical protein